MENTNLLQKCFVTVTVTVTIHMNATRCYRTNLQLTNNPSSALPYLSDPPHLAPPPYPEPSVEQHEAFTKDKMTSWIFMSQTLLETQQNSLSSALRNPRCVANMHGGPPSLCLSLLLTHPPAPSWCWKYVHSCLHGLTGGYWGRHVLHFSIEEACS